MFHDKKGGKWTEQILNLLKPEFSIKTATKSSVSVSGSQSEHLHHTAMHGTTRKLDLPMMVFFNMIVIIVIAEFIIWKENYPDWMTSVVNRRH